MPHDPSLDPNVAAALARLLEAGGGPAGRSTPGERFTTEAQSSFLELLKGITGLGGLAPNAVSQSFAEKQEALPQLSAPQTFGEKAVGFAGHIVPDAVLGVATAPIATGVASGVLARQAGRRLAPSAFNTLKAILAGEAAQSAALFPLDLAREDRGVPGAVAGAVGGTALGSVLTGLFGRGVLNANRQAVDEALGAIEGGFRGAELEEQAVKRALEASRRAPEETGFELLPERGFELEPERGPGEQLRLPLEPPRAEPPPLEPDASGQFPLPFDRVSGIPLVEPAGGHVGRGIPLTDPDLEAVLGSPGLFNAVNLPPEPRAAPRLNPLRLELIRELSRTYGDPSVEDILGAGSEDIFRQVRPLSELIVDDVQGPATQLARRSVIMAAEQMKGSTGAETEIGQFVDAVLSSRINIEKFQGRSLGFFHPGGGKNGLDAIALKVTHDGRPRDIYELVRDARHELGHFLMWRAKNINPDRWNQILNERQVSHAIRARKIIEDALSGKILPRAAAQTLASINEIVSGGFGAGMSRPFFEQVLQHVRGGALDEALGFSDRTITQAMNRAAEAQATADARVLVATTDAPAHVLLRGADGYMRQMQDAAIVHPLRSSKVPGVPGQANLGVGGSGSIQWGLDEGAADLAELMGRDILKDLDPATIPDARGTQALVERMFKPEAEERHLLERAIMQSDILAQQELFRRGLGPILNDGKIGYRGLLKANEIWGPDGLEKKASRMLLPADGPVALRDGRVLDPRDPEAARIEAAHLTRWALTRQEYIEGLRAALSGKFDVGSIEGLKAAMKKTLADKPFRRIRPQEQFQFDFIARRALKRQGLTKPQQDAVLEGMSAAERRDFAIEENVRRFWGPNGEALFDSIIADTPAPLRGPIIQTIEEGMVAETPAPVKEAAARIHSAVKDFKASSEAPLQDLWDKVMYIRKGHLLLHPATYLANIGSTLSFGALVPARTGAAAIADAARVALKGGERVRFAGDMVTEAAAWMNSSINATGSLRRLSPELSAAGGRFREVREGLEIKNPFNPEGRKLTGGARAAEVLSKGAEFSYRALTSADQWMFDRAYDSSLWSEAVRVARKTNQAPEDIVADWSRRLIEAEETLTPMAREKANAVAAAAHEQALKAGKASVFEDPRVFEAQVEEELVQMLKGRPDLFPILQSQRHADRLIFTAREGKRLDQFLDTLSENPVLKNILEPFLPFRRTASNIMREAWRTSPLGLSTAWARYADNVAAGKKMFDSLGEMDQATLATMMEEMDEALLKQAMDDVGQALVGTAIGGALLMLMLTDTIKYLPFDRQMPRKERLLREMAGQGTESVTAGDVSFPMHRLPPPVAEQIRGAQTAIDAFRRGENVAAVAAQGLGSFVLNLTDETFMQGIDELLQTVRDPGRAGPQAIANFGGSFVPRATTLFAPGLADLRPEKNEGGIAAAAKALFAGPASKIGIGEQQVGPLGERRVRTDLFGSGVRVATDDPVVQELVSVEVFPELAVPRGIDLTKSQENDAMEAKGQFQRAVLQRIIDSPGYQQVGDPSLRQAILQRALRKINTQANKLIKVRAERGMDMSFQALLDAFNITGS